MNRTLHVLGLGRHLGILAIAFTPLTLLAGCAKTPANPSDSEENVAEAEQAVTTCIAIQRGVSGNVQDSYLSATQGSWPPGADPYMVTGGGNSAKALVKFDTSAVPANSTVTSATVTIYIDWASSSNTMRVHEVLDPWTETTVSYANFNGAQHYSPTAEATFLAGSIVTKTFDLTNLTNAWITGASANNGILLEEDAVGAPGRHQIYSGEGSIVARRPRLDLCYEVNTDECTPDPCQNGGTCIDGDNSYTCTCPAGWTGTNCEVDVDECASGDPCNLNAFFLDFVPQGVACTNTPGSYTCECSSFYAGAACDVACPCVDPAFAEEETGFFWFFIGAGFAPAEQCITGPSGTSLTSSDISLVLSPTMCGATSGGEPLSPGYALAGDQIAACQNIFDNIVTNSGLTCGPNFCDPNPCAAGNICINGPTSYTCECPVGFTGTNCEINIDDCVGVSCPGGTCIDGVASYTCQCAPGISGPACDYTCVAGDFSGDWSEHNATLVTNLTTLDGTWAPEVGRPPFSGTVSTDGCSVLMDFPDDAIYQATLMSPCFIQWSYANQPGTTDPSNFWIKDDCTP